MKNLQRVAEDNCNCVALLCFLDSHCRWHGSYDSYRHRCKVLWVWQYCRPRCARAHTHTLLWPQHAEMEEAATLAKGSRSPCDIGRCCLCSNAHSVYRSPHYDNYGGVESCTGTAIYRCVTQHWRSSTPAILVVLRLLSLGVALELSKAQLATSSHLHGLLVFKADE